MRILDTARAQNYPIFRRPLVAKLISDQPDLLVVTGLGAAAWDATAAGDRDLTFPLWGAMGGAAMIGLGLAVAQQSRRVMVITGDGEQLMGVGGFATIAVQQPDNLAIAILDNERYGETGMQSTHTAGPADLAGMAQAAGIGNCRTVVSDNEVASAVEDLHHAKGPIVVNFKINAENLDLVLPPKDGVFLKQRFRGALFGAATEG